MVKNGLWFFVSGSWFLVPGFCFSFLVLRLCSFYSEAAGLLPLLPFSPGAAGSCLIDTSRDIVLELILTRGVLGH